MLNLLTLRTFAPIPGFPGYWASADGHIFSTRSGGRGHGPRLQFLTERPHPRTRHLRVDLRTANGKRCTHGVHQLVCRAFFAALCGYYPEGMEVCHNDGDCTNNHWNNLRYDTTSANALDRSWHHRTQERLHAHTIQENEYDLALEEAAARRDAHRGTQPDYYPDETIGF